MQDMRVVSVVPWLSQITGLGDFSIVVFVVVYRNLNKQTKNFQVFPQDKLQRELASQKSKM